MSEGPSTSEHYCISLRWGLVAGTSKPSSWPRHAPAGVLRGYQVVAWHQALPLPPPQSLRCPCGQVIDPQGDHPLGCGLRPLRIKRHDSLRDIIWQALLMENPRAAREQHCGVDNSRPGDIFHPDFVQGKPAYFDVSVRNSLQPQFLCRAASLAGAAGEAGEMAKDARHEEGVIAVGGVFFPLVVETLGLWTTHSLKTLRLIATRASALSGITRSQALSNLLQQLSVKLWCHNSKLVITRLVNSGAFPAQWDL